MPSNERIGLALNSKNLRSDETHVDSDLVAALAYASSLGGTLQMLVSGGYNEEMAKAATELARVLKKACRRRNWGMSWDAAQKAAKQGLAEWMIGCCRGCNGSGKTLLNYGIDEADQKEEQCLICEGTGAFIPTWDWRVEVMSLREADSAVWWGKRIELAKEIADDAFNTARRQVTKQMTA